MNKTQTGSLKSSIQERLTKIERGKNTNSQYQYIYDFAIDPTNIKGIIRKWCEQYYAHKSDNLDYMDQFPETANYQCSPTMIVSYSPVTMKWIEFIVKRL